MSDSPLRLQLSLKGRPMRDYTFLQDSVSIGRDPQADVLIDNMGVSRQQARINRVPGGWTLSDAGSANGTWVNGRKAEQTRLTDGDEIVIGKFALKVGLAPLSGVGGAPATAPARQAEVFDGTTVLTQGQLARVLEMARDGEMGPAVDRMPEQEPVRSPFLRRWATIGGLLLIAIGVGAILTVLLDR